MTRRMPFALVCPKCHHLIHRHGLVGATVEGPYECPCGCQIMQSDPMIELSRADYEAGLGFEEVDHG